eukprot:896978-Pelagomonas_calceolata.AAC.2
MVTCASLRRHFYSHYNCLAPCRPWVHDLWPALDLSLPWSPAHPYVVTSTATTIVCAPCRPWVHYLWPALDLLLPWSPAHPYVVTSTATTIVWHPAGLGYIICGPPWTCRCHGHLCAAALGPHSPVRGGALVLRESQPWLVCT